MTQLEALSEPRRAILTEIKRRGARTLAELAPAVGVSYEAVRQHVSQLGADGWLTGSVERVSSRPGRPVSRYRLTRAGDHLFPKRYDDLAVALIDAAGERLGAEAVRALLAEVAERKVERWLPKLDDLSFEERLEALRDVYLEGDPYCRVEHGDGGEARLVEMNCPYLEVARRRPALCSVTVSVLRRLLGRRVVRSERFQDGDGRCVFRVLDEAVADDRPLFELEPDGGGRRAEG